MAEEVGFEPTELSFAGFRNQCHKPDSATLPKTESTTYPSPLWGTAAPGSTSGSRPRLVERWLRWRDSNPRSVGYEPTEDGLLLHTASKLSVFIEITIFHSFKSCFISEMLFDKIGIFMFHNTKRLFICTRRS